MLNVSSKMPAAVHALARGLMLGVGADLLITSVVSSNTAHSSINKATRLIRNLTLDLPSVVWYL